MVVHVSARTFPILRCDFFGFPLSLSLETQKLLCTSTVNKFGIVGTELVWRKFVVHLPRRDFVCPSCNGALYLGSFWILFSSLLAFSSPFLSFFFLFIFFSIFIGGTRCPWWSSREKTDSRSQVQLIGTQGSVWFGSLQHLYRLWVWFDELHLPKL